MSMKLYVGNLSYRTSDSDLQQLFSQTGQVESAVLITDRETGPVARLWVCGNGVARGRGTGHPRVERQGDRWPHADRE